jgi:hypothetical protein
MISYSEEIVTKSRKICLKLRTNPYSSSNQIDALIYFETSFDEIQSYFSKRKFIFYTQKKTHKHFICNYTNDKNTHTHTHID